MYDKIDLWIRDSEIIDHYEEENFAYFYNNPSFVKVGNYDEGKFLLMNKKTHANKHGLTVKIIQRVYGDIVAPPMLHISGSLRKWYYGELSMNDLTKYDTYCAILLLADKLDIPYQKFMAMPLSSIEVGLNMDCGEIKTIDISNRICYFKDARYKPANWDYDYKRFKVGAFMAKAYDKVNETKKRLKDIKAEHGKSRFLKAYEGKNVLRIEFKAFSGASKIQNYFGIQRLGDLVDKYNSVAAGWIRQTKFFGFRGLDLAPFHPQNNKAKEFTDYLRVKGLLAMAEEEISIIPKLFTGDSRKYVNDIIKDLRKGMPDAISMKDIFRKITAFHFIEKIRESQHQWVAENNNNPEFTLPLRIYREKSRRLIV